VDNTVGSLTQLQRSVIIGSLLGDGHLRAFSGRRNALLEVNHSYKQKDYVEWKYNILKNVSASPPKPRNGNGQRIAYRFHSKQLPELTEFYSLFYRGGKKVVPQSVELDPISLAVWYMDDGSYCRNSDVYLNTQQFERENQKRLVRALKKLGLDTTLNKDKIYFRLRFLKSSLPRLKELLKDLVIPSMRYKLGYNPVETSAT
jgi:hypothetical protein